jgi:hypothetical protein
VIPVHVAVENGNDLTRPLDDLTQGTALDHAAHVRPLLEPAITVKAHLTGRMVHEHEARQRRRGQVTLQPANLLFG